MLGSPFHFKSKPNPPIQAYQIKAYIYWFLFDIYLFLNWFRSQEREEEGIVILQTGKWTHNEAERMISRHMWRKYRLRCKASQFDPSIYPITCCFILPPSKLPCPTWSDCCVAVNDTAVPVPYFVPPTLVTASLSFFASWPSSYLSICRSRSAFFLKLFFDASARNNPFLFVSWFTVYRISLVPLPVVIAFVCYMPISSTWKDRNSVCFIFSSQCPAQGLHLLSAKYVLNECLMPVLELSGWMLLCPIFLSLSPPLLSLAFCLKCPFPSPPYEQK